MSEETIPDRSRLPLDVLDRIDRACDRFEAAWKRGEEPRAEDFLGDVEETYRDALLRDLMAVEAAARSGQGDATIESPPPPAEGTVSYRREAESPLIGRVVADRYKLRQEIGEGGMGSVYLAEQLRPVKRQVALKLIKAGMDSRAVLARFEGERQALALMDHPNIARVLDAGTTEDGRPFFVMELVKGIPLTDYCDQHRLGLPERLALFRQICSAVQHAHQKGIIHRDLKPTNILVESHDGKPVPKVIDFGLAKATSGMQLTEHSLVSGFGTVAGTPLYMAPEQATFNAVDVDTRADIYALGVILYEVLTGSTPIQRDTFKRAALDEMLRLIREVDPPAPSHRLSSSETLPNIAATRHIEPARLSRFVRGDLDWIVMKALSKERHRRYESAIAFAQDIERFTNHEPVSAGPPTATYRLKKFVRRNRGRVVAVSFVMLALVVGIIGTTLGLFEANRQRKAAVMRLTQKDKANEILLSIFKDLNLRGGGQGTLAERLGKRLDVATAELDGEATDDPLTVARMQTYLGESQRSLGNSEKATALLTKARATFTSRLGPRHPETLGTMHDLAECYRDGGQFDRAMSLHEETLALRKKILGTDHPGTIASMGNLAETYRDAGQLDRAMSLHEETLARMKSKLGPDHPDTLAAMSGLALDYQNIGRFDRALPLHEEVSARMKSLHGPDHPNALAIANNLAAGYMFAGKNNLALPILEEVLARSKASLGTEHPETLASMNSLARCYMAVARGDLAMPLLEQSLTLRRMKLGPDHPATLASMNDLASGYRNFGRIDRAVPLREEALGLRKMKLGPDHPDTLLSMSNLASDYRAAGQFDRALSLHEETLARRRAKLGPGHRDTLASMGNVAGAYWAAGRLDRSIPLFEEVLSLQTTMSGADHRDTWISRANLGVNYRDAGRLDEAMPLLEGAYRASFEHPSLAWVRPALLDAYVRTGQAEKAVALVGKLLPISRAAVHGGSPQLAGILAEAGSALLQVKAWGEAEPIVRECLAIREKDEPDAWTTFNTRSMLGGALLGQKKYAEAEPLLRSGYEGMKQRAEKIPPQAKFRVGEALDRLIELAEAANKPDEARAWKAEKANLPTPPASKPVTGGK